jgi:hypothetical protein
MNKDNTTSTKGIVDEAAGFRHLNEEIFMRRVLNRDTHVTYTRMWMFGRNWFGAN